MLKVIFLHEGSNGRYGHTKILVMPMGVLALADLLARNGFKSRVVNIPIEKILNTNFDVVTLISKNRYRIVCLDLHWHHQLENVLALTKKIKKSLPDIPIIIGGNTASFFYRELMENNQQIDFIIRGDAEMPLLLLIKEINYRTKNFGKIPNLSYRKDKIIYNNNISYICSEKVLNNLRFSNFDLMDNYVFYNTKNLIQGIVDKRPETKNGWFFYNCGRGCPYKCSICSGSMISQKIISGRKKIIYKSIASTIMDLKNLSKYNIDTWAISFDPSPDRSYFISLFRQMCRAHINLNLRFTCMSLPSREFILSASKTFNKVIFEFEYLPCSDTLRRKNKSNFFKNEGLISTLHYIFQKTDNIKVDICLSAGYPFENIKEIVNTLIFINYLRNNFYNISIVPGVNEMEPAAPWYIDSNRYGIKNYREKLTHFVNQFKLKNDLGYRTKNFTYKEIHLIKKYYSTESICVRTKSFFLDAVLKDGFGAYSYIKDWHKFCRPCFNYLSCWKQ